eukprot:11715322-Alexandrium_andersonii.AAC.1
MRARRGNVGMRGDVGPQNPGRSEQRPGSDALRILRTSRREAGGSGIWAFCGRWAMSKVTQYAIERFIGFV